VNPEFGGKFMGRTVSLEIIGQSIEEISAVDQQEKNLFAAKASRTVEMIARYLCDRKENSDRFQAGDTDKLIIKEVLTENFRNGYMSADIYMMMNIMGLYGNYAACGSGGKDIYFKVCMPMLLNVLKWFYCDYIGDKDKFCEITNSFCKENEMHSLKEELAENNGNIMAKMDNLLNLYNEMSNRLNEVGVKVDNIDSNVLEVLNTVKAINEEIQNIKKSAFDTEDKILQINRKLDKIPVEREEMDSYISIVKRWLNFDWEKLEPNSRKYLPSAEYLFGELSKMPDIDLSPFIMQYCRTLENEMLKKIFRTYIFELKRRNVNVSSQFRWDLYSRDERGFTQNTQKFAKRIKNYVKGINSEEWFFEFGTMLYVMNLLSDSSTASQSPLLTDLKAFMHNYFEDNITDLNFLKELEDIKDNYRNKSAHSDIINLQDAKTGRDQIRDAINTFLEGYKK
jgi:hypothetical protein